MVSSEILQMYIKSKVGFLGGNHITSQSLLCQICVLTRKMPLQQACFH